MKKNELLNFSEKLSKFTLFDPRKLSIYKEYTLYQEMRENGNRKDSEIDLPELSPVIKFNNSRENTFIITPINLYTQTSGINLSIVFLTSFKFKFTQFKFEIYVTIRKG